MADHDDQRDSDAEYDEENEEEQYDDGDHVDDDDDEDIDNFMERMDKLKPMPEHLVLPLEVQRIVLAMESSQFQCTWGSYRFVCKAWNEYILHLAKTVWVRDAAFHYRGYMARDPGENKVFLGGAFEFDRMDESGENAIYTTECAKRYRKSFAKACRSTSPPAVEVCMFVHDVEIPGMTVDWDTLTITCPWRTLVGRVLAEELRVEAYKASRFKNLMLAAKDMRSQGMDGIFQLMTMYGDHQKGAYASVREERLGHEDKAGDKRLQDLRVAASWAGLGDDDERPKKKKVEEESDEEAVELTPSIF